MRLALGGVLLTLVLFGCGDDNGNEPEPPIEVAGAWSGRAEGLLGGEDLTFVFSLSEAAGVVQGSGVLGGGELLESIDIEGTYEEPEVALTFSAEGFEPLGFVGVVSESTMEGNLNGSGFVNQEVTFNRDEEE